MAESTSIMSIDVKGAMSASSSASYCSMRQGTMAEKAALYNATSNPTHKVGDYINKGILVKDVFVETIEIEDEDTHDTIIAPRVVLIDTKGESYQAVSKGIFNALARLITAFGEPTWADGLPVIVKQVSLGKNQMLTLAIDEGKLA